MRKAPWVTDGDQLPKPSTVGTIVTLSTCTNCGRRWANPPRGVGTCDCPNGDVVSHEFTPTQYSELRWFGEVRTDV